MKVKHLLIGSLVIPILYIVMAVLTYQSPKEENTRPVDIFRMPFGVTSPTQQKRIINDFAEQNNLDIHAEAFQGATTDLIRIIRAPDSVAIVTIGYHKSNRPTLWRVNGLDPMKPITGFSKHIPFPSWGTHTMLLVAYDPDITIIAKDKSIIRASWGFINSWNVPGKEATDQSLHWMTDTEFKATWGYNIPFGIGGNNVVVVSSK